MTDDTLNESVDDDDELAASCWEEEMTIFWPE